MKKCKLPELTKQLRFANLTAWESHTVTIVYCATLVFILSAIFLRREEAKGRESRALNELLMESLPGVVCVFDASGNIRRRNKNFLGYPAAEIMRTGIIGTVAPESLQTVQQTMKNTFGQGAADRKHCC
jgi:acid phosphatase family membrane protein YuiD